MDQISFRFWLYLFTDLFYGIPIIFAFLSWKKIENEQKWFVFYLLGYFGINTVSNILFIGFHRSNLFLCYFYSLSDCIFIFQVYKYFFQSQGKLLGLSILYACALVSIIIDLFWITGLTNQENYFSEVVVSICVLITSFYYLSHFLLNNFRNNLFKEINLFIALSLITRFFLKSVFSFIRAYLFETQSNDYLAAQFDNFNNFFVIITLIIISWAFYNLKANPMPILNE